MKRLDKKKNSWTIVFVYLFSPKVLLNHTVHLDTFKRTLGENK